MTTPEHNRYVRGIVNQLHDRAGRIADQPSQRLAEDLNELVAKLDQKLDDAARFKELAKAAGWALTQFACPQPPVKLSPRTAVVLEELSSTCRYFASKTKYSFDQDSEHQQSYASRLGDLQVAMRRVADAAEDCVDQLAARKPVSKVAAEKLGAAFTEMLLVSAQVSEEFPEFVL